MAKVCTVLMAADISPPCNGSRTMLSITAWMTLHVGLKGGCKHTASDLSEPPQAFDTVPVTRSRESTRVRYEQKFVIPTRRVSPPSYSKPPPAVRMNRPPELQMTFTCSDEWSQLSKQCMDLEATWNPNIESQRSRRWTMSKPQCAHERCQVRLYAMPN